VSWERTGYLLLRDRTREGWKMRIANHFGRSGQRPSLVPISAMFSLVFAVSLIGAFSFALRDYAIDDAYITFRHAQNLVEGRGFSFNGDRVQSTTAPLHGLVLAMLAWVSHAEIPLLAIVVSAVSMAVLCLSIVGATRAVHQPLVGTICVLFVVSQVSFYTVYPLETVMVLALNMATVALALKRHWVFSGMAAGLAVLGRPDAVLLAAIVAVYVLRVGSWRAWMVALLHSMRCDWSVLVWLCVDLLRYAFSKYAGSQERI